MQRRTWKRRTWKLYAVSAVKAKAARGPGASGACFPSRLDEVEHIGWDTSQRQSTRVSVTWAAGRLVGGGVATVPHSDVGVTGVANSAVVAESEQLPYKCPAVLVRSWRLQGPARNVYGMLGCHSVMWNLVLTGSATKAMACIDPRASPTARCSSEHRIEHRAAGRFAAKGHVAVSVDIRFGARNGRRGSMLGVVSPRIQRGPIAVEFTRAAQRTLTVWVRVIAVSTSTEGARVVGGRAARWAEIAHGGTGEVCRRTAAARCSDTPDAALLRPVGLWALADRCATIRVRTGCARQFGPLGPSVRPATGPPDTMAP